MSAKKSDVKLPNGQRIAMPAELRKTLKSVKADWEALPGVVAVGMGPKVKGGEVHLDKPSIRVYVRRKKQKLPTGTRIPKRINGILTDVIEWRFKPAGAAFLAASLHRVDRPLTGGQAISSDVLSTFGTITSMVNVNGSLAGLTAGHVVLKDRRVYAATGQGRRAIGVASDVVLNEQVDAALIALQGIGGEAPLWQRGAAGMAGPLQTFELQPQTWYPVVIVGARSGWVFGYAMTLDVPAPVDNPSGTLNMENQIELRPPRGSTSFLNEGDSGALVLSADGRFGVGMVVAVQAVGEASVAIATPLTTVLGAFGAEI